MTHAEFAALITGREYPLKLTEEEKAQARAAGLVVVYGASDDLMEFRGCIDDEVGAYDGTTARVSRTGNLLPSWESIDKDDEGAAQEYFRNKLAGFYEIEALWASDGDYSWTYRTPIPHSTFEVVEDGGPYCRGIVFHLADLI